LLCLINHEKDNVFISFENLSDDFENKAIEKAFLAVILNQSISCFVRVEELSHFLENFWVRRSTKPHQKMNTNWG